jgi:AcrR family transcriptional regulator
MPRSRYQNVDPAKRAALIEAAMKEFATYGYELASMNRILETAGFSKGSFYYYFDDKVDLAATTLIAASEPLALLGELRSPSTPDEFWSELRRISFQRLRQLEAKRTQYECVMRLSSALINEPILSTRVMPLYEPSRRAMAGFLEQGVAVGALRSDMPLSTLMALIEAAKTAAYKAMFGDRVPSDAEMESFTDLVIDLAKRIGAPAKS